MTRSRNVRACPVLTAACLSLALSSPLLAQRSDRGVIGGVVTDSQGSAVPGATVSIKNDSTGVELTLVTNAKGAYTSNPLVLGQYTVTVNVQGFKTARSKGLDLRAGDAARNDVTL